MSHLNGRSVKDHGIVLQRMIKCNHPQFGMDNKEQLQNLFTFLLQYVHDCAEDYDPEVEDGDADDGEANKMEVIAEVTPFLYDLAQFSPQPSAKAVLSVLMEKYEEYTKRPRVALSLEAVRINYEHLEF